MPQILIKNGTVVLPRVLLKKAAVLVKDKKIAGVGRNIRPPKEAVTIDAEGAYISPGFIDTHIHGTPEKIFKNEIRYGTTSIVIAESCAPLDKMSRKIRALESFVKKDRPGCNILGVRIEGPYISYEKAGAQDKRYIRVPDEKEAGKFIKRCGPLLTMMTLAPEMAGAIPVIKLLKRKNIIASVGHSNATYEETMRGVRAGVDHATHVFNAMSGPGKREPGASDAVLAGKTIQAEIILDLIHVHKALCKLLIKAKGAGKTILITDSVRAEYERYSQSSAPLRVRYYKEVDDVYRLASGTIAGSALTMMGAVKNAVKSCGVKLTDAVKMASVNPAKLFGFAKKKGIIAAGMDADIVIFDEDFHIKTTMINGEIVYTDKE